MMKLMKSLVSLAAISLLTLVFFIPATTKSAGAAQDEAGALYKTKCAGCHGVDGSGRTAFGKANKLRPICSPEVQSQSDDALYDIIAKGKGTMPGYETKIGADKCKLLVGYMRTMCKK